MGARLAGLAPTNPRCRAGRTFHPRSTSLRAAVDRVGEADSLGRPAVVADAPRSSPSAVSGVSVPSHKRPPRSTISSTPHHGLSLTKRPASLASAGSDWRAASVHAAPRWTKLRRAPARAGRPALPVALEQQGVARETGCVVRNRSCCRGAATRPTGRPAKSSAARRLDLETARRARIASDKGRRVVTPVVELWRRWQRPAGQRLGQRLDGEAGQRATDGNRRGRSAWAGEGGDAARLVEVEGGGEADHPAGVVEVASCRPLVTCMRPLP